LRWSARPEQLLCLQALWHEAEWGCLAAHRQLACLQKQLAA